jgi:hypothetical protein
MLLWVSSHNLRSQLYFVSVACRSYLASTRVWALIACKRELTNDDAVLNIFIFQTMDSFGRMSARYCRKKAYKNIVKVAAYIEIWRSIFPTEWLIYSDMN